MIILKRPDWFKNYEDEHPNANDIGILYGKNTFVNITRMNHVIEKPKHIKDSWVWKYWEIL